MRLILLMTAGNNVLNWYNNGSYGREIKLYKVLANLGVEIIIFDYTSLQSWSLAPKGLKTDLHQSHISIVPLYGKYNGKLKIVRLLMSLWTVIFYRCNFTHIKSNQTKGAWLGIILKLKHKRAKFLHRSGYSWSDFTVRIQNNIFQFLFTRTLEFLTNVSCDEVHVASELDTKRFFTIEKRKTQIIPNWVEDCTGIDVKKSEYSIFIGRLEPQKGIIGLLKTWPTNEELTIIGTGSLLKEVTEIITDRDLNVKIIRQLEHSELMKLLGSSKCLVCWSDFEGNPKVVLEALFMGVPVVAKSAPGVREILELGNFGKLVHKSDELVAALSSINLIKVNHHEVNSVLQRSTFDFTLSKNKKFLGI